jgi:DNA-binding transcriptional MerR regulator
MQPKTEEQGFYLPRDAARLARLHRSTVTYWKNQGIIVPTLSWTDEVGDTLNGYSLHDVLYMRLVAILRPKNLSKINTAHLQVNHVGA